MYAPPSTFDPNELVRDDRLHRRIYTDPAVFEAELQRIHYRTWVYLAHESEIPNAGDFKCVYIGRQPLLVCRDKEGGVHVVFNRCTHRAATVCQTRQGHARMFTCAYHGWTFNLKGELVGVPWRDGYDSSYFHPEELGLVHIPRVDTYRGFIFGKLSLGGPSLAEHLAPARQFMDEILDCAPGGDFYLRSGTQFSGYDGNWKIQVENQVDGYHAAFLHRSLFLVRQRRGGAKASSGGQAADAPGYALGNGHACLDRRPAVGDVWFNWMMKQPYGPAFHAELCERYGAERARETMLRAPDAAINLTIYPNLHFFGVQVRVIRPIAVNRTEVTAQPIFWGKAPKEVNAMRLRVHEEFYGPAGFASPDDMEVFNQVTDGLQCEAVEWLLLNRGLHRERVENGVPVSTNSDETPLRGQYAEWKRLMLAEDGGDGATNGALKAARGSRGARR
ncbi:MAG TPA: Rieske 2Fe-2S domain-containing protein [Chloroflexota bacterium]|nr:Rieske 2Fe-2S domain-containing protein [Chloroflexota bacterium]